MQRDAFGVSRASSVPLRDLCHSPRGLASSVGVNMTTAENTREYLSVAEVALRLGVSPPTVRRRIAEGRIIAAQPGGPGSAVRIHRSELEPPRADR
jgi:excisionase family DNA binding protein